MPRPLWQYDVTGGHFNISHKQGWNYLPQPVAPEEEEVEERCHVSGYCCLEGCVMQEPLDCTKQVKVHSQPGSILLNLFSHSPILTSVPRAAD